MPAPGAEQAGAARSALWQLRGSASGRNHGIPVLITGAQMAGLSALATHGLRPDRFNMSVQDGRFEIEGSRRLIAGRWLNVRATFVGKSTGFPSPRLSVGSITLPVRFGRYPFEMARAMLSIVGTNLPPLDEMVREVAVVDNGLKATLRIPTKTGLFDQLAGFGGNTIAAHSVVRAYCYLTAQQRARPEGDFAAQVRRAIAFDDAPASPGRNGAVLIALAMLVVGEKAGYLAGVDAEQVRTCRIDPPVLTLYGRADLPKHWAVSAAIAAAQGTQLASAVGEWKELADSISPQSGFQAGDSSGFSLVDLAADRAGLRTAKAAIDPSTAPAMAQRLAQARAEQLLPPVLLEEPDGLTSKEFQRRFGGLDANRYKAALLRIDRELASAW